MISTINQTAIGSGTFGSASGRVIFTNGAQNIKLISLFWTLTTTATVGNRTVVLIAKDSAGNVLWRSFESFGVTAGTTFNYNAQVGLALNGVANTVTFNLGNPCYLPINGTLTVLDQTNVDTADAINAGGQLIYEF